jgi:hypothetical protein
MTDGITTLDRDPEVKRLLAEQRKRLGETTTDRHTKTDDSGEKIKVRTVRGPGGTSSEVELNMSTLLRPTPSTTADVDLLVTEAELVADGVALGNPHIPADAETLAVARDRIDANGHTPAWDHNNEQE